MIFTWLFALSMVICGTLFIASMFVENFWYFVGSLGAVIFIILLLPLMKSEHPSCTVINVDTYKEHGIFYNIYEKECIIEKTGEEYIDYELVVLE